MNSNLKEVALWTLNFIRNTVLGHERGFFNAKSAGILKDINLRKLTPSLEMTIKMGTAEYFNYIYEKLVTKDDPYVNKIFGRYAELIDHSPNCLIGILFRYCLQVNLKLDRSQFVDEGAGGIEAYSASVSKQLNNLLQPDIIALVEQWFDHECKGERDITPLPPGQKLFYFSEKKPDNSEGNSSLNFSYVRTCAVCNKPNSKKCARCGLKYYCSVECQKLDWKEHKPYCSK